MYATNLNSLASEGSIDPLVGREKEIERTIQILCRRRKNNPLLVGEAGVGKTAIAYGLAKLIVENNDFAKNENSNFFIRIDSFSDSSIDMLVQAFTVTNEWSEYLRIKEELAVSIKQIVESNNAGFAFPSQSLYVESYSNEKPEIFNSKSSK